jgi:hypothetical protein
MKSGVEEIETKELMIDNKIVDGKFMNSQIFFLTFFVRVKRVKDRDIEREKEEVKEKRRKKEWMIDNK